MASWALNPCHVKNKLPVLQGEGEQRPKTGSSWSFSFIEPKWTKTSDLKLGRWVLWDRNGLLASYLHFLQHHANLSRSNQELPLVKYNDNGNEGKTNIPPDITEDKGEIWRSKVSLCNLLDVEKWSWQQARKHKCNFQTFLLWEKEQPRFVLNTNFTILHSIMTCASLKQAQFEAPATKAISYRLTQQLQLTGWGWWSRESRFWTDFYLHFLQWRGIREQTLQVPQLLTVLVEGMNTRLWICNPITSLTWLQLKEDPGLWLLWFLAGIRERNYVISSLRWQDYSWHLSTKPSTFIISRSKTSHVFFSSLQQCYSHATGTPSLKRLGQKQEA